MLTFWESSAVFLCFVMLILFFEVSLDSGLIGPSAPFPFTSGYFIAALPDLVSSFVPRFAREFSLG